MGYIEQANLIIHGERNEDYGPMSEGFNKTASIWTALLSNKLKIGVNITAQDVCILMMGLKLSRESFKHKDDNLVDTIGYAEILGIIQEEENKKVPEF